LIFLYRGTMNGTRYSYIDDTGKIRREKKKLRIKL